VTCVLLDTCLYTCIHSYLHTCFPPVGVNCRGPRLHCSPINYVFTPVSTSLYLVLYSHTSKHVFTPSFTPVSGVFVSVGVCVCMCVCDLLIFLHLLPVTAGVNRRVSRVPRLPRKFRIYTCLRTSYQATPLYID